MNEIICISHPQKISIGNWSATGKSKVVADKVIQWESSELETPNIVSCIISFEIASSFNYISIGLHETFQNFFPSKIRFEISSDAHAWEPLLHEMEYSIGPKKKAEWNFPLSTAKYLKLVFIVDKKKQNNKYFIAIGEIKVMISGSTNIEASTELDRLWVKENLVDKRSEYGWSTAPKTKLEKEYIQIDLGSINQLCEIRILSKNDIDTFFPVSFQFLYSEDNISWHLIFEENSFLAESACWYRWRFFPVNAQFVRLLILEGARTHEGKYISQIIELELYATSEYWQKSTFANNSTAPSIASILRHGLVRLATDKEKGEGIAVQASDSRLLNANTDRKGIVELASHNEKKPGVVVQADDPRIQNATENRTGIVRLARDGESRSSHVLQSNDKRLELASEEKQGLVKLASDGEDAPNVVVQGNDKRLKTATTGNPGILKFAKDGSENPNEAIQASDLRLQKATTETCGIVQLSRNGEKKENTVVQANDCRLLNASTEKRGIIQLAKAGEHTANKAVQANDPRLKSATEEEKGIIQLAKAGENTANKAIQANDPRLLDARQPKPHNHDYASKNHDYDSHTGTIRIKAEQGKTYEGTACPDETHAPVVGTNKGNGSGLFGKAKEEGVIGAGESAGLLGLGLKEGNGVVGLSRQKIAGHFLSENTYSLVAGGFYKKRKLNGSSLALFADGVSRFEDSIFSYVKTGAIASYFEVEEKEDVRVGDLVSISENGKKVSRVNVYGNSRVIGVVVEQAALIVNIPANLLPEIDQNQQGPFVIVNTPGYALISISGIVEVKAMATKKPIVPGDLLVSSPEFGYAEKLDEKRYIPGIVFARSLDKLSEGKGIIKVIQTSL